MIDPPKGLPEHLKTAWVQATESAFQSGVEQTLLHLSKKLGCDLSLTIDAEFLAPSRADMHKRVGFGH